MCPGWHPGGAECQAVGGLLLSRRSPGRGRTAPGRSPRDWCRARWPRGPPGACRDWGWGKGLGGHSRAQPRAAPRAQGPGEWSAHKVRGQVGGEGPGAPQLCHSRTPAVSPPRGSCAVSAPAGPWAHFVGWTSVPGHLAPHCPSGSATDPVPLSASASTTLHGAPAPVLWAGSGLGWAARCPPPEAVRSPPRAPSPSALPAPTPADHAGGRALSRAEAACPA